MHGSDPRRGTHGAEHGAGLLVVASPVTLLGALQTVRLIRAVPRFSAFCKRLRDNPGDVVGFTNRVLSACSNDLNDPAEPVAGDWEEPHDEGQGPVRGD